ncbi:MAG TPA: fructosamine kinase family protein [Allosphingosinicella sp.]|jgi:fructosamine-3-kinase
MSVFSARVAALTGVTEQSLEPLVAQSLSEVLLVRRPNGGISVAKSGPAVAVEAAMLRAILGAGVPAPAVEAEHEGMLILQHIENDAVFSPRAWADVGARLRQLHHQTSDGYGWPVDYQLGTVRLDNRETRDWPAFWGEQRLVVTASILDRPWRERVDRLAARLSELLPSEPRASLLHGDLWTGNILVQEGRLVGFVDPACYFGHGEVDLAMIELFDSPSGDFSEGYGSLEPGWEERRPVYQLFPAISHVRLWGQSYYGMVDRLLSALGF